MTNCFALCALLLTTSMLAGQQTIDLNVVVTAKSGPPIADLQSSDFTLLDNKEPQRITSFRAVGSQEPVHVILVIDAVNITFDRLAYVRGQMEKFLHANGGELAHPTQFAFFTDKGIQIQEGFSTDGNELNTSFEQQEIGLQAIRRSSQFELSDRLQLSLNALRLLIAHEGELPGRKMIVWISPGWPLLSGPGVELDDKQQNQIFSTIVDISTRLRQAQTTLYNVNPLGAGEGVGRANYFENYLKGVSKPSQVAIGDLSLPVLALQSGGLALFGGNDTAAFLQQCVADARASYEISFAPRGPEQGSPYHHIEVRLSKPGLTARTRQGYYGQP